MEWVYTLILMVPIGVIILGFIMIVVMPLAIALLAQDWLDSE